jgi:hypothetical protein
MYVPWKDPAFRNGEGERGCSAAGAAVGDKLIFIFYISSGLYLSLRVLVFNSILQSCSFTYFFQFVRLKSKDNCKVVVDQRGLKLNTRCMDNFNSGPSAFITLGLCTCP